jgi:hypothetical protein
MDPIQPISILALLKNRIDLETIPFSERGSRLLVLRHAPASLSVRLAERWFKATRQLAAYRDRPPILDEITLTGADGEPLPFQLESYPHRLDLHTAAGTFAITFADAETLLVALPPDACGLTFVVNVDQGETDRRGGILRVTGDIRRNIAYTTNRAMAVNEIRPVAPNRLLVRLAFKEGPRAGLLLNLTPRLGFNRYVPELMSAFQAAAKRWEDWFAAAPPVAEPYRAQYYYAWWIMRAGLISTRYYTTREAMTPSKVHYVGIWQWDAYFHALAYRFMDMRLARDQIRVVLDHQRPDGMIPDAVHDEGTVTHLTFPVEADVTKPPLLAWSAWKLFETDGDVEFLQEIYEPIVRWNHWWFEHNDTDADGLCEYLHPYSSGLDDSPLWDEGMPVTSPDLNTYLVMQMDALARIASAVGEPEQARMWDEQAQTLVGRMIMGLWDEQAGLFWAKRNGKVINTRTPFNLFPLITGRLPEGIAARLVEHLSNPDEFWPAYPVPTVARDDPKYSPTVMWRGPAWINVNYLLVEGLERSGYNELAETLRQKTLDLLMGQMDIYEYYNPETGGLCPKAASTFGWSAALFIELALQASKAVVS